MDISSCRLTKEIQEQIIALTKQAITAMNIKNSPSHTEIIVTGTLKIVELLPDWDRFITSRLVPLSTGGTW